MQESPTTSPIVYADQRKRKVFIMSSDRSRIYEPKEVTLEDKAGNLLSVPTFTQGLMTVLDVGQVTAGGYLVRFMGKANQAIRVILF